jgi:hypothetical protein
VLIVVGVGGAGAARLDKPAEIMDEDCPAELLGVRPLVNKVILVGSDMFWGDTKKKGSPALISGELPYRGKEKN